MNRCGQKLEREKMTTIEDREKQIEAALKRCPFCGCRPKLITARGYSVVCMNMNCKAPIACDNPEDALEIWNKRASPSA
jgi:hypothetical protein